METPKNKRQGKRAASSPLLDDATNKKKDEKGTPPTKTPNMPKTPKMPKNGTDEDLSTLSTDEKILHMLKVQKDNHQEQKDNHQELLRQQASILKTLEENKEECKVIKKYGEESRGMIYEVLDTVNKIGEECNLLRKNDQTREKSFRLMEFAQAENELMITGIPIADVPKGQGPLIKYVVERLATDINGNISDMYNAIISARTTYRCDNDRKNNTTGEALPPSAPIFLVLRNNHCRNMILGESNKLKDKNYRIARVWPRRHTTTVKTLSDWSYKYHKDNSVKTRVVSVYDMEMGQAICVQARKTDNEKWAMVRKEKCDEINDIETRFVTVLSVDRHN